MENRPPSSSRLRVSRPRWSVPSQWAAARRGQPRRRGFVRRAGRAPSRAASATASTMRTRITPAASVGRRPVYAWLPPTLGLRRPVDQVRQGGHGHGKPHHHHHPALRQRDVAVEDGVEEQPSHARDGEDDLDDDGSAQQPGEPHRQQRGERHQPVGDHVLRGSVCVAAQARVPGRPATCSALSGVDHARAHGRGEVADGPQGQVGHGQHRRGGPSPPCRGQQRTASARRPGPAAAPASTRAWR